MRIAIDISPLQTGHSIRGVGFYVTNVTKALLQYHPEHEYLFFQKGDKLPSDIDLVHYPYFDPFFQTLPFVKRHKTVVTVHDLTPLVFPTHFPAGMKGNIRWLIQKHALQQTDAVITDSESSKQDILRIVGMRGNRVNVVSLAGADEYQKKTISKQVRESLQKKYHLPDEFILSVGDVTWNKNLPRLVEACNALNLSLVMVGKSLVQKDFDRTNVWNADLVKVQSMVRDVKNIHMLGFVSTEDLVLLYNLATVFVFPSVYEGFGLPVVEAMQSGCPIILSKESCLPEVGGDAAVYFDGYDTDSLIAVIKQVWGSKSLQQNLSEKGLQKAKQFSWKKTANQTVAIYEKIM
jgi:glycosyltransferase involved in cell wall biosynthesis